MSNLDIGTQQIQVQKGLSLHCTEEENKPKFRSFENNKGKFLN